MPSTIGAHPAPELIKTFLDKSPIGYVVIDRDFRVRYINESNAKLRGLDASAVLGVRCYDAVNGGERCAACLLPKVLETGEKAFILRKDTLPDGSVRYIDDYAIPLRKDAAGKTDLVLEILIDRTAEMLARKQMDRDYDEILSVLVTLLERKDDYTAKHSQNVRRLSINLALALNLPIEEIHDIALAATLHDLGKVDIPYALINKPGLLTPEERMEIRRHPVVTGQMLEGLSSYAGILQIARHHHERVDGKGYPDGLTDGQIPLGAKIIAVADAYDAIVSSRSYRPARPHAEALREIARSAGTQFDKAVADAFVHMDFDHLLADLDGLNKARHVRRTARRISSLPALSPPDGPALETLDMNLLLEAVFQNTPCGYLLMDARRTVLYASDYYLDFAGLQVADVVGKACFDPSGIGSGPCAHCPVKRALRTGDATSARQEHYTATGRKVCDVCAIPLMNRNGTPERVIKTVIDRTRESDLALTRRQDFRKLIDTLAALYRRNAEEFRGRDISGEVIALRNRLNRLLAKRAV